MTNQQLYLSIGIPVVAIFISLLANVIVVMWNAKTVEKLMQAESKDFAMKWSLSSAKWTNNCSGSSR